MGPAQQLVNIRRHPHMFARRHLARCARKSIRCRPPLFANMTGQQFPKPQVACSIHAGVTTGSQTTQTEWHQVVPLPTPTHTPFTYTDNTDTSIHYLLVFGSEGWGFESLRARQCLNAFNSLDYELVPSTKIAT